MNTRGFFLVYTFLLLLITGCSSQSPSLFVKQPVQDPSEIKLSEVAVSVSQSLNELAAIERANSPKPTLPPPPNPASIGMPGLVSVDWNGPVAPLVKRLAIASHYRFRVLGKEPAIPVIVQIRANNEPIADVIRNVSYQVERKADIVIYPSRHIIELRYLPG